jgi:hypothetical protein
MVQPGTFLPPITPVRTLAHYPLIEEDEEEKVPNDNQAKDFEVTAKFAAQDFQAKKKSPKLSCISQKDPVKKLELDQESNGVSN